MNVFVLSRDPEEAARMQCDKHVVKMVVETAQILATVSWLNDVPVSYRATHVNHPVVKWTNSSLNAWTWLVEHGIALGEEYTRRYSKFHASVNVIQECLEFGGRPTCIVDDLKFVLCMPEKYKCDDPVESYRKFYVGEKKFAKWNRIPSSRPSWFDDMRNNAA